MGIIGSPLDPLHVNHIVGDFDIASNHDHSHHLPKSSRSAKSTPYSLYRLHPPHLHLECYYDTAIFQINHIFLILCNDISNQLRIFLLYGDIPHQSCTIMQS